MEIQFTKQDELWVAEFEVTGDFNVHIERGAGALRFYQKTAGSAYDYVSGMGYLGSEIIFDRDFVALVYPKIIKISSETMPTVAVVTFA